MKHWDTKTNTPRPVPEYMSTFDEAWAEAEAEARKIMSASQYPAGVRLIGPFPMIGRPFTYQAEVWDVDGHRYDETISLGESPAEALLILAEKLRG